LSKLQKLTLYSAYLGNICWKISHQKYHKYNHKDIKIKSILNIYFCFSYFFWGGGVVWMGYLISGGGGGGMWYFDQRW
jgi:hypothetical protein